MHTVYLFKEEQLLTVLEALTLIQERLGESCGDIRLDLDYIESLDKLGA